MLTAKAFSRESDCRAEAARAANEADASLWRWFCNLYQEGRIRWCRSSYGWLISIDHKHLATDDDFDAALRNAYTRHRHCTPRSSTRKP